MCKCMFSLFAALSVVLMPSYLAAEEVKRPQKPRPEAHRKGPSPERMFQRLDANHDKAVTADELPADMPEQFKKMLLRADADKDGKLTIGELRKSFQQHRDKQQAKVVEKRKQPGKDPKAAQGKDPKKFAKAVFVRLDKDKNGQLCFEEFADGMRQFQRMWIARAKKSGKQTQHCRKPPVAKKHHVKGPKPHDGKYHHTVARKPHGWWMHAQGPHCFCCMWRQMGPWTSWMHPGMPHYGMGPWGRHGMQFGMNPWGHHGMMHYGMGPWGHHGMQFGMNPWHRPGMNFGMGPCQGQFPKQSWGQGFPAGPKPMMKHWGPDSEKKQWSKKPKMKIEKPKGTKFETGEDSGDERIMRIESRLTALERQQEAMLAAIQQQQAAMMAALERTNELVGAKLASLGRHQERVRPMWDEASPENELKELARVYEGAEQPRESYDQDRD
ncbi:MAG: EF-hand domain-containing protein [Pirellulales bacterium]|nr:EF-hand domain-containing protein [Pirellulales bacterium]